MYYKFILLLLVFTIQSGFGQKSKLNQANKLFDQRSYIKAAELFKQLPQTYETLTKHGDCFYYNGLMEKAADLYIKAAYKYPDSLSSTYQFKLAQSLYGIEKIILADSIMGLVKNSAINTLDYKENLTIGVPYLYDLTIIKSGSLPGDFGANFYGDEITFASSRSDSKKTYSWNEKPYLNIYKGKIDEEANLLDINELSNTINTKQHESNAVISADGETLYFSRSNKNRHEINGQKIATVGIYKAKLVNDEWTDVEILPFCSNTYSTQHPALDEVNNRLYFASDMPGGYGSFDIYYVDITENGFGEPVNLGGNINTPYREQFPFVSKDSVLYFSSEGHQVLGGMDIFFCETLDKGDWSTPLNLGPSINTGLDDFAFIVNSETNKGYLSSNRSGSDKIYAFTREDNDRKIIVEGFVRDKNSKELLPGTMVTLFDEMHNPVDSMKVGNDGLYKFRTKPKSKYFIEGFKPLYIPNEQSFNTDDSGRIELNIELELESYDDAEEIVVQREDGYVYIELENIYFDLDKWDIKPQAARTLDVLVDLMIKYPRMEVELGAHTDNRSTEEYNLNLSENRAQSAFNYIISKGINKSRLKAIGYGESQLLVNCGEECTEDEHAINRRCEFIITK
jgi:outer membrane protein OmpA-like peptidoglycan-associated protein